MKSLYSFFMKYENFFFSEYINITNKFTGIEYTFLVCTFNNVPLLKIICSLTTMVTW